MKKGMIFFVVVCIGFVVASCGAGRQAVSPVSLQGEWNIVEVDGEILAPANGQPQPSIGFDVAAHRIYGNSGCNRMMGIYTTDSAKPGSLIFGSMGGTRMACPDMVTERDVLVALEKVKSYKLVSCSKGKNSVCKIALCDDKGKTVVVMEKAPVSITALNGEWTIIAVNGKKVDASEKEPFIAFDVAEGRIYGSAGCNNMNGALKQDEKNPLSINFDPIATTMMACPDMTTERRVLDALNLVKSFDVFANGQAGLYNANGDLVVTLNKK